jgi:magnesium transporter
MLTPSSDQGPLQARRQSIAQGQYRGSQPQSHSQMHRQNHSSFYGAQHSAQSRPRLSRVQRASGSEGNDDSDDRTPLLGNPHRHQSEATSRSMGGYGGFTDSPAALRRDPFFSRSRGPSAGSSRSGRKNLNSYDLAKSMDNLDDFDVNNPPSVPSSPKFGSEMGYDDVMLTDADFNRGRSPDKQGSRDALIDIDDNAGTPPAAGGILRRMTLNPVDDVCFPQEDMTEIGEDEYRTENYTRRRRGRAKVWPDLDILEEWSREEKEQRTIEGIRARKINEPLMVGGRLRPQKTTWHREVDDVPLRFTYFNEDFDSTLHSQSLSELIQEGQSFRELFMPDAPILSDSESDTGNDDFAPRPGPRSGENGSAKRNPALSPAARGPSRSSGGRPDSRVSTDRKLGSNVSSNDNTGHTTPNQNETPKEKQPRYGSRPIWWLDVLSPTDAEMKVLSKAFSIHPLTAEDVMMQEQREKVELFRNYYFVNYRTFEQDTNSEDYMEPVNMYVIIFREGVISFHFSQTPHPANVRRRIRQLTDYLILTTDWISYAIIDDITDAYAPLAERIEEEVDDIDETILGMHSAADVAVKKDRNNTKLEYPVEKKADEEDEENLTVAAGDMLRRVGECRKKVMSLYRLLGTKADVIKGFAKRCNEQWEIAPRSEIGLYLGDIQDHIVTMTGNLSHYEK